MQIWLSLSSKKRKKKQRQKRQSKGQLGLVQTILWICGTIDETWSPPQDANQNQHSPFVPHLYLSRPSPLRASSLISPFSLCVSSSSSFSIHRFYTLKSPRSQVKLAGTNWQKNPKPQKAYFILFISFSSPFYSPIYVFSTYPNAKKKKGNKGTTRIWLTPYLNRIFLSTEKEN